LFTPARILRRGASTVEVPMSVTRKRQFPFTVTIDGEPVRTLLKRMTVPEFEEFQAQFVANGQQRGSPITMVPPAPAVDGETPAVAALAHLTPEEVAREVAYLKANAVWLGDVFDQYVSVVAGDVIDEDETGGQVVVTNGRQFADMYPGQAFLSLILLQLYTENALTEGQKKKLASRSDSATGSRIVPSPAAAGATPAPTVPGAERVGSVSSAAVTEPSSDTLSGTMARSSSESVPCAI
jgi:hypothetical protein